MERTQLPDGPWPATPGQEQGSWTTAPACWTFLVHREQARERLDRGLNWLLHTTPGDAGRWWRFVRRLTAKRSVSSQSDRLYGWSWTQGTASWVGAEQYALTSFCATLQRNFCLTTLGKESRSRRKCFSTGCVRAAAGNCGRLDGVRSCRRAAGKPNDVWALLAPRDSVHARIPQ